MSKMSTKDLHYSTINKDEMTAEATTWYGDRYCCNCGGRCDCGIQDMEDGKWWPFCFHCFLLIIESGFSASKMVH